jgi:exopolysaccharide biosynthesis polyprenyl glycosylphosphotransferase
MPTVNATAEEPAAKARVVAASLPLLRRSFPAIATSLQLTLDVIAIFSAFAVAYAAWVRVQPLPHAAVFEEYLPLCALILVVELVLFLWMGMYRRQKSILNIEEFRITLKATIFGFLIITFLHFLLEESVIYPRASLSESGLYRLVAEAHHAIAFLPVNAYSRYVIALAFLFIFLFVAIERWIAFKGLQYLHLRGVGTTNIVIVGAGDAGRLIQKRLFLSPRLGFNLVGFLDDGEERVGERVGKSRILGTFAEIDRVIAEFKVGMVLFAMPELKDQQRRELAEACLARDVEVAFVPGLVVSRELPPLRVSRIETVPLLSFAKPQRRPLYATAKRLLDLSISSLAIVINLPIFLLLPIVIRLTSAGPAFFRQVRIGKDGQPFEMLKFRTMHRDAPKYQTSPRSTDDPRLTGVGRWLRRTSVDELPQLFNVLRGEMSIVGPRPEMPFIVERYDSFVRQRLNVKPGMTGLWQISHARDEDIHENVDYDLYYVENATITMDIVIVILTVFSVLRGVGAR